MKRAFVLVMLNILMNTILKVNCVTLLPHGPANQNDIQLVSEDESTEEITTLVPFTFYGITYNSIWITSNGFLGFGDHTDCCFADFPHEFPIIAVLWDDWEPGILYYRQTTTDVADLEAATTYVRTTYPAYSTFQATWALVVTWSYFILWWTGNVFSTFQAILASDGTNTFAVFLYDRIDGINDASVGIDAGDGTNFYQLCGAATAAVTTFPDMKQTCTSEPGVFVFRMDSNNPDQATYVCTPILLSTGTPEASYFCKWTDASETSLEMTFTLIKPQTCGLMAWDTQKYEDGDDPDVSDPTCETVYSSDPTILTLTVDPDAMTPACGIRVTGTDPKELDFTVRAYYSEDFDTGDDVIFRFNCSTDTAIPASAELSKVFSDIEVTQIPTITRTVVLQVTAPNIVDVLSVVQVGQLIQLTVIYDNTANNIDPYGVNIEECIVGDTMDFDTNTFQIIQAGCVVEQDPDKTWYMSRAFQQTSLSASGLFIADSGLMTAVKFTTEEKIFFKCIISFCFFTDTAPNKCTDSCSGGGRRKRSINDTIVSSQTLYTSVKISALKENLTLSDDTIELRPEDEDCIDELIVFLTAGLLGLMNILSVIVASVLFWKIFHKKSRK